MTAGRKPRPGHLRAIDGSRSKAKAEEFVPVEEISPKDAPPDWMTETQAECWRHAMDHAPRGLIRKLDRTALTVWVVAEDLHREASKELKAKGLLVPASKAEGAPMVQNPLLQIINRQAVVLMKAVAELGFSPTSRSRIALAGGGKKDTNRFSAHAKKRA